ncbi:MAG TPA: DUF2147 domain-containing protein [Ohtaekwangia sp.]|uniref:DUF2147 domain-containing protein n=1 Tax=Ohtaekwangia sp. TaxID=2066019 RepID=UPI002F94E9EB
MKILTLILLLAGNIGLAQKSILGQWKSVDDSSGEEKSIVDIFEKDGKVFGKIIRIFPAKGKDPDPVCTKCPEDDARFKKKIIGMEIIQDMEKSGEEYSEGNILDPEEGKIYRCKLWIEGKDLKVRGYWGPFYRTQTWKRLN